MRMLVDRWLDDERIRGVGDDGQREGGIPLEMEGVYVRLCLTQFRQPDGHLPNRRAFLCDAVACPSASYERLIVPVLERFFRRSRDGARWYNVRTLAEWQNANNKSLQAKAAAEVKWRKVKESLAPGDAAADPDGSADAACERERESKRESKKEEEAAGPDRDKGALELLRCPYCGAADTIIRDRPERPNPGWWCAPRMGGCKANFPLDDPRIVDHLPANVQRSVRAQLQERAAAQGSGGARLAQSPSWEPDREADAIVAKIRDSARSHMAERAWATWVRPLVGLGLKGNVLRVGVPDKPFVDYLRNEQHAAALRAAQADAGHPGLKWELVVHPDARG
jgi:hypothetical protein